MPPASRRHHFGTLCLLILLILTACRSVSSPTTPTPAADVSSVPAQQGTNQPPNQQTNQPTNQPTDQPSILAPSTPESARPEPGGTAILGLVGQPDSLNPITDTDPALRELSSALFETLLRVDPQTARLQAGLAQSLDYAADGRQVTFHLPPDLQWSDGTSLTAAEVADSLQATRHPALLAFSQIDAPDRETLRLTFASIDCAAVTTIAQLPLLRAAEITATVPTGSGPYTVANWSDNKRSLTLSRNPNYHDSTPLMDELIVRFLTQDEVTIALSEGQFDLVGPLQAPTTTRSVQSPSFTRLTYPAPEVIYLAINFDPKNEAPVAPDVRQALRLALDRQAILAATLDGEGQLLAGPLLPDHWAANPELAGPEYDPERASSLLRRAGLRDRDGDGWLDQSGEPFELSIRLSGQNRLHQDLGWLISSYYRDLGLLARAEGVPFDSLIDDLFTHDFRLAIFRWPILPDPDQRQYWHSTENSEGLGLNFVSYDSPEVDELLEEAVAVPGCEPQARAELYGQVQAIMAEEGPVDFLLTPNQQLLVAERLQGVQPGPFAPLTWNVTEWFRQGE